VNKLWRTMVIPLTAGITVFVSGCATTGPVRRIEAGGPTAVTTMGVDLADLKQAAGTMIGQMLAHPAIGGFEQKSGRKPLVDVGAIVNNSDTQIDLGQLAGRINEDLLNSGLVEIKASDAGVVDAVQENAWVNDRKALGSQKPDFLLEGKIMLLTARDGRTREKSYSFQLRLNDTKTGKTVFQKTVDVAKQGKRSSVGW